MEAFFMVWCEGGNSPNCVHADYGSARREAKRLAMEHPNKRFIVLQSIEMVEGKIDVISSNMPLKKGKKCAPSSSEKASKA